MVNQQLVDWVKKAVAQGYTLQNCNKTLIEHGILRQMFQTQ
jgi:hypothetical protein